jgi:hypothetical protein
MSVRIDKWVGRLGNNIMQLSTASAIAKKHGTFVDYPSHNILNKIEIQFGNSDFSSIGSFFGVDQDRDYVIQNRFKIMKEIGKDLIPHEELDMGDTMVFHFRGGDIFKQPCPEFGYVQCPMSYYDLIMEREEPNSVMLVCEDDSNNLIAEFTKRYEAEVSIGDSLENDISKIMNAQSLVCCGMGSFIPALAACSTKVEKMYCPMFEISSGGHYDGLLEEYEAVCGELCHIRHDNYIKIGEWSASDDQRRFMMTYPKSGLGAIL